MSFCSDGRFSQRADAPEAMMTVRVSCHSPSIFRRNGRLEKSTSMTEPCIYSAPKCSACFFMFSTRSGPLMPSGKPGKVLDKRGDGELTARLMSADNKRLQIRPRRIDGRSVSGAAGADDHNVSHGRRGLTSMLTEQKGRPGCRERPYCDAAEWCLEGELHAEPADEAGAEVIFEAEARVLGALRPLVASGVAAIRAIVVVALE